MQLCIQNVHICVYIYIDIYMYLFQIKQFIFFSGKFLYLTFKNLLTNKLTNISIQQKINLQEVEKQSY